MHKRTNELVRLRVRYIQERIPKLQLLEFQLGNRRKYLIEAILSYL
jgi:hypothetical protein